jgi:hypothetical protein
MAAGDSAQGDARKRRSEDLARRDGQDAPIWDRLASVGWLRFDDVPWPGRAGATIDHILVGPGGVVAIDVQHWSGKVVVRNGSLKQNGRSRQDSVAAAKAGATATRALLPSSAGRHVLPVLALIRDERLDGRVGEVRVCTASGLLALLGGRKQLLDEGEVAELAALLRLRIANPGLGITVPAATDPAAARPASSSPAQLARLFAVGCGLVVLAVIVSLIGAA